MNRDDSILFSRVRQHANRLARTLPGQVHTVATNGGSGISLVRKEDDVDGLLAGTDTGY